MILDLDFYLYLFSVIPIIIFVTVSILKRRNVLYILGGSLACYLLISCLAFDVFPICTGGMAGEFIYDGRWFGFIIKPFDYFPSGFDFIAPLFKIYWKAITFSLLLGFVVTIVFKHLRKFVFALIFNISFALLSALAVILPSLISGGVNKSYDTSCTITGVIAFMAGYLLARVFIALVPEFIEKIDYKATKVKKDKKIRRRKVEISDSL